MSARRWFLFTAAWAAVLVSGCASWPASEPPDADRALARLVQDRLGQDAVVGRNAYVVASAGGQVTLSGVVRNESERARVVGIARGTPGVQDVVDRLRRY